MDLKYKKYTDKDYAVDEVFVKINANNYVEKIEKKELKKLKTNTLLVLLSKLKKGDS